MRSTGMIMDDSLDEVPQMMDNINISDEERRHSSVSQKRWPSSLRKGRLNLDDIGEGKMTSQCSATASMSNSSSNLTNTPNSNKRMMRDVLTPVRTNTSFSANSEEESFVDHVHDDDYYYESDSHPLEEEEEPEPVRYKRKVRFGEDVIRASSSGVVRRGESDKVVMLKDFRNRQKHDHGVVYREEVMGGYSDDYLLEEENDSTIETSPNNYRSGREFMSEDYFETSTTSDLSDGEIMREVEQVQRDLMAKGRGRNFHIESIGGKLLITDLRPESKQRDRKHHKHSNHVYCPDRHRSRDRNRNLSYPSYYDQQQPHQDSDSEVYMENSFTRQDFEERSLESTLGPFDDSFFVPKLEQQQRQQQQHVVHEQITKDHCVTSSSSSCDSSNDKYSTTTTTTYSRITQSKTTISIISGGSTVSSLSQKTGNIIQPAKTKDDVPIVDEEEQASPRPVGRWQKMGKALKVLEPKQTAEFFASENWYTLNDNDSDFDGKKYSNRQLPFGLHSVWNTAKWITNRRYTPKKTVGRVGRFISNVLFGKLWEFKPSRTKTPTSNFERFQTVRKKSKELSQPGRKTHLDEASMDSSISSDKNQPSPVTESISMESPPKSPLSTNQINAFDIITDDNSQEKNIPKESSPTPKTMKEEEKVQVKATNTPMPRYTFQEPDKPSLAIQKHLKKIGVSMNPLASIKEESSKSFSSPNNVGSILTNESKSS